MFIGCEYFTVSSAFCLYKSELNTKIQLHYVGVTVAFFSRLSQSKCNKNHI